MGSKQPLEGGLAAPAKGEAPSRKRLRGGNGAPPPQPSEATVSLGALLTLLPDGVCVADLDGRIAETNDRFCEMVRLPRDQVIGARPPYPWWPPERKPTVSDDIEADLASGCSSYELEYVRGDGERFRAAVSVTNIDRGGGRGFLAVARDRTEELGERRRRRHVERSGRLVTWEWDPVRDRMHGSNELLDRAGLGAERKTLADVLTVIPDDDAGPLEAVIRKVAAGERDEFSIEVRVDAPNAEIGWVEIRGHPLHDEGGRVMRVAGVTQDITDRRRSEDALRRNRELLRMAERLSGVGSFETDDRTGAAVWSENLYRLFGVDPQRFSHRLSDAQNLIAAEDRERFLSVRRDVMSDGVARVVEHRYRRGDELRWAETRLEALRDGDEVVGVRGTLQDITERRRAEAEARLQALLLDSVDTAVVTLALDGRITHWNAGAEQLYGWTAAEAIGEPVTTLAADQAERAKAREMIRSAKLAGGKWRGEFKTRRKDHSTFTALVQSSFYSDENGEPAGIVGTAVDLSERVDLEERLRAARDHLLAVTDSIGEGVYTLDEHQRLTYANPATERMLGWSAAELEGKVMHDVIHFRRPDGSDFPISECPESRVQSLGETVHVEDDVFVARDGREIAVEYTAAPIEGIGGSRGVVVVFSDITERKLRQAEVARQAESLSWIGRIHDALENDGFEVFAQPIVDLANDEVVHHELLIRMRDDDGELIPPGRFLPVAEEIGLIVEIDRWMIDRAAERAAEGHAVHVNLSAESVGRREVTDGLVGALRRTGADPQHIVIELTETALLSNELEADRFMRRLRQIGCRLALDDFGTGYGGFSYLKRLPVDYLKIDREFVGDLADNDASRHVVTAVVNLAQGFGQATVAEGIEDDATLELLRGLGVDFAQGFHVGHPVPAAEAFARP